ncbi:glutaredoxin family protein [Demequina sp.]|uniref:glutaredoxin family protein n=1 Tax=Demequina sp. TaxID=2050685 RepID=UPI003D115738
MSARVVMYTRAGCHLCDDALEVVAAVCQASGSDYQLVDVDADPSLKDAYGEQVPVVTVDGSTVGFWRIDPQVLAQALA